MLCPWAMSFFQKLCPAPGVSLRSKWPKPLYSSPYLLSHNNGCHTTISQKFSELSKWSSWLQEVRNSDLIQGLPMTHHFSTWCLTVKVSNQFLGRSRSQGLIVQGPGSTCQSLYVISLKPQNNPMMMHVWLCPLYREENWDLGRLLSHPYPHSSKLWDENWIVFV